MGKFRGLSPRMRGNRLESPTPAAQQLFQGLSPRMRGNPIHGGRPTAGVYPRACEPAYRTLGDANGVYPRACGGTMPTSSNSRTTFEMNGSIPAHAGEPTSCFPPDSGTMNVRGLSPRMRGNQSRHVRVDCDRGLSPRMRGNPGCPGHLGSPVHRRVYPRACGGTTAVTVFGAPGGSTGSIPAHAGEPNESPVLGQALGGVYPRACGGTDEAVSSARFATSNGSIPAHAGEPADDRGVLSVAVGSIPAHAGEPPWVSVISITVRRVYPRACGGTPRPVQSSGRHPGVYPRACGGTDEFVGRASPWGLSPRMRGNQASPRAGFGPAVGRRVYPRACGGTVSGTGKPGNGCMGSIPAHAGEPRHGPEWPVNAMGMGSIPAHAGEPCLSTAQWVSNRHGSIPAHAGEPGAAAWTMRAYG